MDVIIGAASGMGAAVAQTLADRGPFLLADRNGDGEEIVACDITRPADVDALVAAVAAAGELDALVVTAGLSPGRRGGGGRGPGWSPCHRASSTPRWDGSSRRTSR
jgi:NAD(P)-dependent dehydrogenase (short-subunit alcohol dehydrogenase family)